ncbi:EamA-like transporter family protein [Reichenbachiella faecimaris]|uniref:EamA-like transporter family protein n=1 Tax=Reichenbachiella faecimaris TaxID=692418 RepID=A0A1W2GCA6_REIFA|nr:DMT family transporter [Reichenbachiella faecimaris]SMD34253.1 EamA-like transporter family protein [Reichenbachiella faecimaris]
MSDEQNSPGLVSWLLLVLLALVWGSSFILIKKSLLTFSAGEVGTLRMFIAFLGLSPFALPVLKKIERKRLPVLFLVGFVGSLLPAILFAIAQTQLESAITGVINAMTPVFVLLIGLIFFHHKIKTINAIGITIGFIGCSFIMLGGAYFDLSGVNLYALFVIAATVMYGTSVNLIKHYLTDIRSLHITAISFTLVSPISLGYLLIATDFLDKAASDPNFLPGLAYVSTLALVGTAMALVIFNKLVKTASPIFASSVTYVIPIVAIGWGLVDDEVLNAYQIFGIGIVLAGVYLANKK